MLICKSSVKIKAYNKITDILIIKIDIVHKIFYPSERWNRKLVEYFIEHGHSLYFINIHR